MATGLLEPAIGVVENTCKKTVPSRKQNATNAKNGHLARVCHSKTKQTQLNAVPRQARAQNSTHHMEEIETTDEQ